MNTEKLKIESLELVNLIQSGQLSREMILTEMSEMNRKYPGIGWDAEMNKLRFFWIRQDKILPFRFKMQVEKKNFSNKMEIK